MKKIYFGGGCFWGVEKYFKMIDGVLETEVGYANGRMKDPTYEDVKTGTTDFVEACKVVYDEEKVSLMNLLDKFFEIIDPVSVNKQGADEGTQYRTGIYYVVDSDRIVINKKIELIQPNYEERIVTEVQPLEIFYKAEEYHQDYLTKNPNGYCHIKF